jgi:hypothetical protein
MLTASTGLVLGGLTLPALILPATATVFKLSPKIGEKIASSYDKEINENQKEAKTIVKTLHPTNKKNTRSHSAEKNIKQELDKTKLKNLLPNQYSQLPKLLDED